MRIAQPRCAPFTRPDAERQLKLLLARQMTSIEQDASMFGGEDSVILSDRNTAAIKVLEKTLKDPAKKQIAVFYGAAHMPDLEKRLKTLGFTHRQLAAVVAWQASVAAIIGIVVGVPLGIGAGRWLWILFAHKIFAVPQPTVPVMSVVVVALGALVLANLVAALPGRSAARTPAALILRTS